MLTLAEVEAAIAPPATRVLCLSWVHSFSGRVAPIEEIGALCRQRGIYLVVNGSQAVGARVADLSRLPVDALLGVGFKWLCGPYGTGYCWVRPELREEMVYNQRYWLSMQTAEALEGGRGRLEPPENWGARRYDIFGTANFFNYTAWTASIERIVALGVERIEEHDQTLVERLVERLDRGHYRLFVPEEEAQRSTLCLLSHRDPEKNRGLFAQLASQGVHVAMRSGRLRVAPHFYNSLEQIDRLCELLLEAG